VVKEVNTKDDIFGFKGGYPARFVISDVGIHNAQIERLAKREIRKNEMTGFLVTGHRNQGLK
jgi:hypothetical protein